MARIPLNTIVGWFLDGKNYSKSEYRKAYAIAIRGWRRLNWDVTGQLVPLKLPVDCSLIACIPEEVISITKVGLMNDCGEFAALTRNDNLSFNPTAGQDIETGYVGFYPYQTHNTSIYPVNQPSLGVGSHHSIGDFRLSEEQRIIVLRPDYQYDHVWIEALVHEKINGHYTVNEMASEALLAFLRWQWSIDDRQATSVDRRERKNEWKAAFADARYRIKVPMRQDMNQTSRMYTMQGLKS